MSLAKKMYLPPGAVVPAVHLPADVDLGDVRAEAATPEAARAAVAAGRAPALFWFVTDEADLRRQLDGLAALWRDRVTVWVFYPKKPHLGTDLGRDRTWALLGERGIAASRQVGIDDRWSVLYCRPRT